jgi:hypothetical protein
MSTRERSREVAAAVMPATYALGALFMAGEGIVHAQQYTVLFHDVRWVGVLFLGNAVAALAIVAGLLDSRLRTVAALGGVTVSAIALGSLVVSYGHGLFGWQEGGFRTPVQLAVIAEVGAIVCFAAALAASARR